MKDLRIDDPSRMLLIGVSLIGLGIIGASRQLWPGLLLLGGAVALIDAHDHPARRTERRVGVAMIALALWSFWRFSIPALLIGLGACFVLSAAAPIVGEKPRADRRLD